MGKKITDVERAVRKALNALPGVRSVFRKTETGFSMEILQGENTLETFQAKTMLKLFKLRVDNFPSATIPTPLYSTENRAEWQKLTPEMKSACFKETKKLFFVEPRARAKKRSKK